MINIEETKNRKMVVFRTVFASEMGGIKDLLVLLGKKRQAVEIHCEYEKRKMFGPWGLPELARVYGNFSEEKLKEAALFYAKQKTIKGVKELTSFLKEKGYIVGAVSSDPQFMLDRVKEDMGLDFSYGSELKFERGIATGDMLKKLDRYDRANVVKQKGEELNITKENIITLGRSSITHLPTAEESSIFIGFNPARENIVNMISEIEW